MDIWGRNDAQRIADTKDLGPRWQIMQQQMWQEWNEGVGDEGGRQVEGSVREVRGDFFEAVPSGGSRTPSGISALSFSAGAECMSHFLFFVGLSEPPPHLSL